MALFEKKTIVHNEIDYDKLAETIIAVQEKNRRQNNKELETTISNAIETAMNKAAEQDSLDGAATFTLLQLLASGLLFLGFIIASCLTISATCLLATNYIEMNWQIAIILWLIDITCFLISAFIGLSAIEIYWTKNTSLINTAFSALMAFAAIVIAIAQIFQGGGNSA